MNPYKILGVIKEATKSEIKKAFRKKAKSMHPDKGGKPEEFIKINIAYNVLVNSERRKRYDDTGDYDSVKDNNADIYNSLCQLFDLIISRIDYKFSDVFGKMKYEIDSKISEEKRMIKKYKKEKDIIKDVKNRILKDNENSLHIFLVNAMENKYSSMNKNIAISELKIEEYKKMIELLKGLVWKQDVKSKTDSPFLELGDMPITRINSGSFYNFL